MNTPKGMFLGELDDGSISEIELGCHISRKCFFKEGETLYEMLNHKMSRFLLACFEWAVNIQRDSYASYVGHYPMLAYFAIAENESIGRERYNFMQKMLLPCGLPPEREEE
ncbi:hypothetical protein CQW23_08588 [Capsicum baccatum]|uniref:Splicing factor 3B subunit 5 n=1 Tax=Capsicum baccatum TaxID=33114 RepID=A0A2G2X9E6_CAPBA|nr:hypothetical protein CQW23_08588 [Capsicum baccatum]